MVTLPGRGATENGRSDQHAGRGLCIMSIVFDDVPWPEPSPEAAELLRTACAALLEAPGDLVDLVDRTIEASASSELRGDPSLMALVRESNRSNLLHWARANVEHPGRRVPPNVGPVTLDIARDVVRRGQDEAGLHTYRRGQAVAMQYLRDLVFAMVDDLGLVKELLDLGARSIAVFVDDTVSGIEAQILQERRDLRSGAGARRLALVRLLLEGAPVDPVEAAGQLRYGLDGPHTAAIVWADGDGGAGSGGSLEGIVTGVARAAGVGGALVVAATVRSLWVWLPVDAAATSLRWDLPDGVQVAQGATRRGVEGFRRSHLDARAVRVRMRADDRVRRFEEVEAAILAGHDPDAAADFVARTLGGLVDAAPDVQRTVREWVRQDGNVAAAARALHLHRNTAVNRLATAESLVPGGLAGRAVEVGLALDLLRWPPPTP